MTVSSKPTSDKGTWIQTSNGQWINITQTEFYGVPDNKAKEIMKDSHGPTKE